MITVGGEDGGVRGHGGVEGGEVRVYIRIDLHTKTNDILVHQLTNLSTCLSIGLCPICLYAC